MDKVLNPYDSAVPRITDEHVVENQIHKMRVKHATQVFSKSMAKWIEKLAEEQS